MLQRLVSSIAIPGILLIASPVFGHHSFAAEYDAKQPIELSGRLTQVEWVNPHGWIHLDVKGPDGAVVNWAVEFGAPNALLRRGLRKTDFPVGVEIVVKGYRAKNGSPTVNGTSVKLPDGRSLFTGSSANGAAGDTN